jgi:hypothetical protein
MSPSSRRPPEKTIPNQDRLLAIVAKGSLIGTSQPSSENKKLLVRGFGPGRTPYPRTRLDEAKIKVLQVYLEIPET